jgi:hypothetical protein
MNKSKKNKTYKRKQSYKTKNKICKTIRKKNNKIYKITTRKNNKIYKTTTRKNNKMIGGLNENKYIPKYLKIFITCENPSFNNLEYKTSMNITSENTNNNIYFNPLIPLVSSYINNDVSKFVNEYKFIDLNNTILNNNVFIKKKDDLVEATKAGNVENNIELTLKNIFKIYSTIKIKNIKYKILDINFNSENWNITGNEKLINNINIYARSGNEYKKILKNNLLKNNLLKSSLLKNNKNIYYVFDSKDVIKKYMDYQKKYDIYDRNNSKENKELVLKSIDELLQEIKKKLKNNKDVNLRYYKTITKNILNINVFEKNYIKYIDDLIETLKDLMYNKSTGNLNDFYNYIKIEKIIKIKFDIFIHDITMGMTDINNNKKLKIDYENVNTINNLRSNNNSIFDNNKIKNEYNDYVNNKISKNQNQNNQTNQNQTYTTSQNQNNQTNQNQTYTTSQNQTDTTNQNQTYTTSQNQTDTTNQNQNESDSTNQNQTQYTAKEIIDALFQSLNHINYISTPEEKIEIVNEINEYKNKLIEEEEKNEIDILLNYYLHNNHSDYNKVNEILQKYKIYNENGEEESKGNEEESKGDDNLQRGGKGEETNLIKTISNNLEKNRNKQLDIYKKINNDYENIDIFKYSYDEYIKQTIYDLKKLLSKNEIIKYEQIKQINDNNYEDFLIKINIQKQTFKNKLIDDDVYNNIKYFNDKNLRIQYVEYKKYYTKYINSIYSSSSNFSNSSNSSLNSRDIMTNIQSKYFKILKIVVNNFFEKLKYNFINKKEIKLLIYNIIKSNNKNNKNNNKNINNRDIVIFIENKYKKNNISITRLNNEHVNRLFEKIKKIMLEKIKYDEKKDIDIYLNLKYDEIKKIYKEEYKNYLVKLLKILQIKEESEDKSEDKSYLSYNIYNVKLKLIKDDNKEYNTVEKLKLSCKNTLNIL